MSVDGVSTAIVSRLGSLFPEALNTHAYFPMAVRVCMAVVIFLAVLLAISLIKRGLHRVVPRVFATRKGLLFEATAAVDAIRRWFAVAVATWSASQVFPMPGMLRLVIDRAAAIVVMIQVLIIVSRWINYIVREQSRLRDGTIHTMASSLASVTIIATWVLALLLLLDNFGFNVATILAGLGVGGIAVGLALQSLLGDVIASFAIGFDRPFAVGDFIIVDTLMGTVERVGLKTTHIRALSGEQLVLPNSSLVSAQIRNFKRMEERRIVFHVGVTYDTPQPILEEIPHLLRASVESVDRTRFDRAHFTQFGESALVFEVVYFVLSPDYTVFMDVQQAINFSLRQRFLERDISFAFPTRTLDLAGPVPVRVLPPSQHEG